MLGPLSGEDTFRIDASTNLMATECQEKVSHKQLNLICSREDNSLWHSNLPAGPGREKILGSECYWD